MCTAFSEVPQNFFIFRCCFNPFEEKLDLPSVVIWFSNHYRADSQSIGKEYKLLLAVLIKVDYSTDLVRILLHCQLTCHIADGI